MASSRLRRTGRIGDPPACFRARRTGHRLRGQSLQIVGGEERSVAHTDGAYFAAAGGLDRAVTGSTEPARHRDLGAALDLSHDRLGRAVPERRSTLRRRGGRGRDGSADRFQGRSMTTLRATSPAAATRTGMWSRGRRTTSRSCISVSASARTRSWSQPRPCRTVASPRQRATPQPGSARDCSGTFSSYLARSDLGDDRR